MEKDLTVTSKDSLQKNDSEYVKLVSLISDVWEKARGRAAVAVNTELLEANWQTGRYIVEFEQQGNIKAEYGKQIMKELSKELRKSLGTGFSVSNLFNMRRLYIIYPKFHPFADTSPSTRAPSF